MAAIVNGAWNKEFLMLRIDEIYIENMKEGCITDNPQPSIRFSLASDRQDTVMAGAHVRIGEWETTTDSQLDILYDGALAPFTAYPVVITARDNHGESAAAGALFTTGRLGLPWEAKWITDKAHAPKKGQSPLPMTFRKGFSTNKPVARAYITATAIGIFELSLNGRTVTNEYFAPGFTSYKNTLQYVYYDVTDMLKAENELLAVVGGGWAVGRFTYASKSQITAKRQAFLMELFIEYVDGSREKLRTDESWRVTMDGNHRFGDFYDGETYDATVALDKAAWKNADVARLGFTPRITARYGCPVTAHEAFTPLKTFTAPSGETIYDFGQNFAGVVRLEIDGQRGQTITVRHAEILAHGELCVNSLRTAKAMLTFICTDGKQVYSPKLTYMGFRYVGIRGIAPENIRVLAYALYSDIEETGAFECSDPLINKLQSNITWSGKSNFVDIPTDCPQRDERQGWTGDISIFASTACYQFDLSRFLDKWLADVRHEQGVLGGIPLVVPKHGNAAPTVSTACWGDSCILVPWAEYLARGSKALLEKQYPCMRKYHRSVERWAALFSVGRRRYIWKLLFQFGDWCAPDGYIRDWMKKGKWIATAYFAGTSAIMERIAAILGKEQDAAHYHALRSKICDAYRRVFTDGNGKLAREFQTGYVLPLYFGMVGGRERENMTGRLNELVKENGYHLSTGFAGTPYLLFALADNGYADSAYRLLLQDTCPSWLYEVKAGGTTLWERWDAVGPDHEKNGLAFGESDKEASFNHYAYGAVGDFLYRRVLGIEAVEAGYKSFRVKPLPGGGLTWARGGIKTPYGTIAFAWRIEDDAFRLHVEIPVSTTCMLTLPGGETKTLGSGTYEIEEPIAHQQEEGP